MLNCREVTESTSDYLDAILPWRVRLQMRMHLWMCRYCREYVRQLALVVLTLRQLPRRAPEDNVYPGLLATFRSERQ
jgi:predicted anti-sigma-YlaC factor YlaD